MAQFTPINTQEEFDTAIKERIERERAKYADYETVKENAGKLQTDLDTANGKISQFEIQVSELNSKVKAYEADNLRTKVALKAGIPFEYRDRIKGDTEEEMKKDAAQLAELIGEKKKKAPPLKQEPGNNDDAAKTAYKSMLSQMFGE